MSTELVYFLYCDQETLNHLDHQVGYLMWSREQLMLGCSNEISQRQGEEDTCPL